MRSVQTCFFEMVVRVDATLVERVFALFFIDHLVNRFG